MNQQLLNYIKEQTALGIPKETIIQNLKAGGGWSEEEIMQASKATLQNQSILKIIVQTTIVIVFIIVCIFIGHYLYKLYKVISKGPGRVDGLPISCFNPDMTRKYCD